ncbi:glycoside hydrolase family 9 protein [Pararcticibacter amylolyticus]|uniref:Glycosyl transferase n=1 Tax=Pararcticibacter amylolyticus TaxID=2173175 RepID=A0A2U2PAA0_9SPHI|nr:glycoside hydrolase family 9 protein [Pararcticibacter amylolyticus]PWG78326.1 glycosyl transferase [Pararcticibacter amylolyticus]
MKRTWHRLCAIQFILFAVSIQTVRPQSAVPEVAILSNQVVYNSSGPKLAVLKSSTPLPEGLEIQLKEAKHSQTVFTTRSGKAEEVSGWEKGIWYSRGDFSGFSGEGEFQLEIQYRGSVSRSHVFRIERNGLACVALPAIVSFFHHQRADSKEELEADKKVLLFGSTRTVDLRGGWCDASGDVSKYFSHLAYTNFMLPQQIPMVTWAMVNTAERIPSLLEQTGTKDALATEAVYGADYIMRSLSPEGYFYMTVFSYFNPDPGARRVVGLLADSKTTSDYQCAYREGGGMAIAALARVSGWKMDGEFSHKQYLAAAERAFAHLQQFSLKYADDGKDNIIDDYCALMASSELWMATGKPVYRDEARKRAGNLCGRLSDKGYFIANDADRPFWHAADAGLPLIALARYLDKETDPGLRERALLTIRKSLDYNLVITQAVTNPFGYPRQSFLFRGKVQDAFFIPHENESGWWWQGEDARLGSLAAAVLTGGRLVYPDAGTASGVKPELEQFAGNLVSWILGCNPYDMCMMYGYGRNNVPYMKSMYGHGSGKGGISNGITGKDGMPDGSGIDFKVEDNGNEWRWSEQWIPHTAWFLQAVTAFSTH